MSYILEALKKSERERESSNLGSAVPVIESTSNAGVESASVGNYWWVIGFIVCSVCIGFISIKIATMDAGKEVQDQLVGVKKEALANSIIEKGIAKEQVAETIDEPISQPQTIKPTVAAEQAPGNIQSLLPVIKVSSHIYSSLAERRSIVVNGERLVETDFITPKVQVKEITHQGMIVKVEGWSLVVSRSRGWSR